MKVLAFLILLQVPALALANDNHKKIESGAIEIEDSVDSDSSQSGEINADSSHAVILDQHLKLFASEVGYILGCKVGKDSSDVAYYLKQKLRDLKDTLAEDKVLCRLNRTTMKKDLLRDRILARVNSLRDQVPPKTVIEIASNTAQVTEWMISGLKKQINSPGTCNEQSKKASAMSVEATVSMVDRAEYKNIELSGAAAYASVFREIERKKDVINSIGSGERCKDKNLRQAMREKAKDVRKKYQDNLAKNAETVDSENERLRKKASSSDDSIKPEKNGKSQYTIKECFHSPFSDDANPTDPEAVYQCRVMGNNGLVISQGGFRYRTLEPYFKKAGRQIEKNPIEGLGDLDSVINFTFESERNDPASALEDLRQIPST